MAKVTITIEGETDELQKTLRNLFGNHPTDGQPSIQADEPKRNLEEMLEWTPELTREFWKGLATNAKRILTEIAKQPNGVPINEVRDNLGIKPGSLAGSLAPVGFAMNRIKKRHGRLPSEYPYHSDYSTWTFHMPQELAEMILEVSEFNRAA